MIEKEGSKLTVLAALCCIPTAFAAVSLSEQSPLSVVNCILLLALAGLTVACLLFLGSRKRLPDARTTLAVAMAAAVILRVLIAAISPGHATDMSCFTYWSQSAATGGLSNFYTSGTFADYPPGYVYVLFLVGKLTNLLGIDPYSVLGSVLVRLPSILCDVALGWLLYRAAKKTLGKHKALCVALVVTLNPLTMLNSAAWGQVDSVLALALVGVFLLLQKEKLLAAGALYGLSILIKPQALMVGPVFAMFYLHHIFKKKQIDRWKATGRTALAAILAVTVVFLLSLPFQGSQEPLWIVNRLLNTAGSYPWGSVNAFNLIALLGGNWVQDSTLFLGLSWKTWGIVGIGVSLAVCAALAVYAARKKRLNFELLAALSLSLIFCLAHSMHERYMIPVLFLLLLAYCRLGDERLKKAYAFLSGALFLNVGAVLLCSFYDCYHLVGSMQTAVNIFSALLLASVGYLLWVCCSIVRHGSGSDQ